MAKPRFPDWNPRKRHSSKLSYVSAHSSSSVSSESTQFSTLKTWTRPSSISRHFVHPPEILSSSSSVSSLTPLDSHSVWPGGSTSPTWSSRSSWHSIRRSRVSSRKCGKYKFKYLQTFTKFHQFHHKLFWLIILGPWILVRGLQSDSGILTKS